MSTASVFTTYFKKTLSRKFYFRNFFFSLVMFILFLLTSRRPADVTFLVVTVILLAIDGMFWAWTRSKFREELGEGGEAELDPAPAVSPPIPIMRIRTAFFRVVISLILRRSFHSVRSVVHFQKSFQLSAKARSYRTASSGPSETPEPSLRCG